MTSQINPNNINGSYPVAGQDNSSQGFRDNFTNTRTNFQFAAAEISDLQAKALLKAPLTGTSVVNNDLNGSRLVNGTLQDMGLVAVDLQTISGPVTIDYSQGSYQYNTTTSGSVTLNFINFPSSSVTVDPAGSLTLRLTITSVAHTVTLSNLVLSEAITYDVTSLTGIQGLVQGGINGPVITFAQTGTYELRFTSTNGGSTIIVEDITRPRNYYTNPLFLAIPDLLSANGNLLTTTTTSVITSNADPLTANLAAGTSGQIKIITYGNSSVGNATVTVDNAAWGGANTASFVNPGDACTLQYINNQWFVIGNNGVTLA